ncbi:protein-disulfide reductase DsbD [Sulfurimonas aquatica]|uniref:Protein-disulfide reductase DsbD n=1 Tax=Sulfurimonas aquatica TaxID=2672570 RepID=A0A975GDW2_9BACT|nr:protein-disulfide reductase DsbD [Sulfurimonas aquatica]
MYLVLVMLFSFTSLHGGDFLMPEEAFKPYAKVNSQMNIVAGVELGDDIYLYEHALKLELKDSSGVSISKIDAPKTTNHHDEEVYLTSPEFTIKLKNDAGVTGLQDITFVLSYQGCSELGLCYEPAKIEYKLSIDTAALDGLQEKIVEPLKSTNSATQEKSQMDQIADTIKSGSVLAILLTFFGFGLLLAMTPCVFPMIPIISGLIISQGEGITTKKAFALSVTYVLAMAVAYTIAGVLAGLFGANLQAALQTPWVVYSFSFVFVALAFSMFGFYELKLPDSLVAKVSSPGKRSGFVGVAIMGFLSALIVGPCVAAPLAGALVYIGQTGDALLGGLALFFMSIGMGIPLIVVGVSAGKFMPKPGAWMTMVTAIFGVMMLAVAIWMLEKVVAPSITMILYSLLGIGFSFFLGVFDNKGHFFRHSVAMVIFIYSVSLFVGFLAGYSSMTEPLGFLKQKEVITSVGSKKEELAFEIVRSVGELDTLLEKNRGKKILLDFAADWCTSCKELDHLTFGDEKVKNKMNEFVLIRADVTKNTDEEKALSKKYGVFGPPAILFFDKDSKLISSKTVIGFVDADTFLKHLNSI